MKKSNLGIIILVIIMILTIIIYFAISGNNKKQMKRVEPLYNYFNTGALEICEGLFNYSNSKITENDISSETKLCLAYKQTENKNEEEINVKKDKKDTICTVDKMVFRVNDDEKECTYRKMNKSILNDTYHKIFGKDIDDSAKSFQADILNVCYIKGDNVYCGLSKTFTYTFGEDINIYRVIEKIVEKGSSVEIYDYFLKTIGENKCYSYFTSLENDQNTKCSDNLKNTKNINYKFLKNNGTLYKHVYEKDNDTFHWVSSEPILE